MLTLYPLTVEVRAGVQSMKGLNALNTLNTLNTLIVERVDFIQNVEVKGKG